MNLVVDRIVNNIAVCQDLDTKIKYEVDTKTLTFNISDGDIITLKDGEYYLNKSLKEERIKIIQEKLNRAKNN